MSSETTAPVIEFSLLSEALDEVRASRATSALSDPLAEQTQVYKQALIKLFKVDAALGQNILSGLWKIYSEGMIMFDGVDGKEWNPEDFETWFEENVLPDAPNASYASQLAAVVARVFQDVHAKSLTKNCYIVSGKRLSVDMLINKEGLVAKLTVISKTYSLPTVSDADRLKMLTKVYNGTLKQVQEVRDNILNGGSPVKIPYFKTYSGFGDDARTSYTFPNLDHNQQQLLEKLLGRVWEAKFGANL